MTVPIELRHAVEAPLPAVEAALLDPSSVTSAPFALRTVARAELLGREDRGDVLTRRASFHLAPGVMPGVLERLGGAVVWTEHVRWSRPAHRGAFVVRLEAPHRLRERVRCEGVYVLEASGPITTRAVLGELSVRVPLIGPTMERRVAEMLALHFEDEARMLTASARGRAL